MSVYRWLMGIVVVGLLAAPASMSFAASPAPAPAPAQTALLVERQAETQSAAHGYAARETASAAKVEKFQGGSTGVYIGGTTAVIVLLVIIVIILL